MNKQALIDWMKAEHIMFCRHDGGTFESGDLTLHLFNPDTNPEAVLDRFEDEMAERDVDATFMEIMSTF